MGLTTGTQFYFKVMLHNQFWLLLKGGRSKVVFLKSFNNWERVNKSCSEELWSFHTWSYSKSTQIWPWATCCKDLCFRQRWWTDHLQKSLPTSVVLLILFSYFIQAYCLSWPDLNWFFREGWNKELKNCFLKLRLKNSWRNFRTSVRSNYKWHLQIILKSRLQII